MKNKILLTVIGLAFATLAQARGHLTGDVNHYGLSATETVTVSGSVNVSTQVGPITFNGVNYGIVTPTASSSNASSQIGVMSPFASGQMQMTSTQAPQSEQDEVAQLQAQANQGASGGDGTGNGGNPYSSPYDNPLCWTSGDHSHFIDGCTNQCWLACTQMGAEQSCSQYTMQCNSPSTNAPFENPYAGEVWWACNGVMLPPTYSQLQTQVTQFFQSPAVYAGIKASMMSFMSSHGIPSAAFQYKQSTQYADALQQAVYQTGTDAFGYPTYGCDPSRIKLDTAQVSFSFFLDQSGQITTSAGNTSSSNPQFLYIKYFSKALQPNVPPPVTQYYPYAGQFAYQMLDANMQPTTQMQYLDVSGGYDAADNSDPSIQAAVTCIANHANSGCNASLPDANSLAMLAGGNNTATVIDYAAQIDADYSSVSADGTSSTNMMNWALQEQSRTLTYPECGFAVLENQGNYSMLLDSKTNRYLVQNGSVNLVNTVSGQSQTNTRPFDVTQAQNPISGIGGDQSSILDPTGSNSGLIPISQIQPQDILQMAPLSVVGSPPPSSYYAIGNTVCDVTNQQTLTPQCPSGFTASLDASGNPSCSGTCPNAQGQPVACTQPGTFTATPW